MKKIKVEKDKNIIDTPTVACIRCKGKTKHSVLSSIEVSGEIYESSAWSYYWDDTFQIIQCRGCETISFRKLHQNSEDFYDDPDSHDSITAIEEILYPSRSEERNPIKDDMLLPINLQRIYQETIKALNSSQPVLAGIGIRAIIETVCKEKEATGNDLFTKINELVINGVLTQEGAVILHKLRVLGNKAAHEVKPHSNVQLDLAMNVIDHLLMGVYILPYHASKTLI